MKPQYIRLVMSSNNNPQINGSPQNTPAVRTVQQLLHQQNSLSSFQVLKKIESSVSTLPTRIVITSRPTTFHYSNETIPQQSDKSNVELPVIETFSNSPSSLDVPVTTSKTIEAPSTTSACKQRPYNDDSLLSDSIVTDETQSEDIQDIVPCDLNATQVSEQVNDCITISNTKEASDSHLGNSNNLSTPSGNCTIASEIDLMQELLGKIEDASEIACRSEMNQTTAATLLHVYLSKKKRLNNEIINIRSESQRLLRKLWRYLNLQNTLVTVLLLLMNNSFQINRRGA
ncbi:unnamed protein product [Rotaria sp. Silwood1]|nr:unnamed protein product [Rotaria sp. Silwood1]